MMPGSGNRVEPDLRLGRLAQQSEAAMMPGSGSRVERPGPAADSPFSGNQPQ